MTELYRIEELDELPGWAEVQVSTHGEYPILFVVDKGCNPLKFIFPPKNIERHCVGFAKCKDGWWWVVER